MLIVCRAHPSRLARALGVSAMALCVAVTVGCRKGSTSTTAATAVPVAATVAETFSNTVGVGGSVFYSFPVPQSSITTAPGSTVQLSGAYGPGIFCIKVFDSGLLTAPVVFTAKVAHP